jgi:hypothetical protein
MPERARTDLWELWGSNPPGPPGHAAFGQATTGRLQHRVEPLPEKDLTASGDAQSLRGLIPTGRQVSHRKIGDIQPEMCGK